MRVRSQRAALVLSFTADLPAAGREERLNGIGRLETVPVDAGKTKIGKELI